MHLCFLSIRAFLNHFSNKHILYHLHFFLLCLIQCFLIFIPIMRSSGIILFEILSLCFLKNPIFIHIQLDLYKVDRIFNSHPFSKNLIQFPYQAYFFNFLRNFDFKFYYWDLKWHHQTNPMQFYFWYLFFYFFSFL